jgi:hypothetical protein
LRLLSVLTVLIVQMLRPALNSEPQLFWYDEQRLAPGTDMLAEVVDSQIFRAGWKESAAGLP